MLSSVSWFVATDTEMRLARRKSTPRMGKVREGYLRLDESPYEETAAELQLEPLFAPAADWLAAGANQVRLLRLWFAGLVGDEAKRGPRVD